MRKKIIQCWCSALCSVLFVLTPLCALADGVSTNNSEPAARGVLITEFQTGSNTSGKDEFIELYNAGASTVNIAHWQLRYISSSNVSASLAAPTQTITIMPASGAAPILLTPGGYFILHTAAVTVPAGLLGQVYTYTLPASGGSLALFASNAATCHLDEQDAVAWGSGTFGLGSPVAAATKDADYQRTINASGQYRVSGNNADDFAATTTATPGATNNAAASILNNQTPTNATPLVSLLDTSCVLSSTPPAGAAPPPGGAPAGSSSDDGGPTNGDPSDPESPPVSDDNPSGDSSSDGGPSSSDGDPQTPTPITNQGLASPQLTELLPNPAAPQTDVADEFVELYNSNNAAFDLSHYKLAAGTITMHYYTFANGTLLPPKSFVAFFSADTGLSLANNGGQVLLLDPNGSHLSQTQPYGTAADGQAWALADGGWYWTTTPTPNAPNSITTATVAVTTTASAKTAAKKVTVRKASSAKATKTTQAKPKSTKAKTATAKIPSAIASDTHAVVVPAPIHASVLAFAALFALLYGAYEYRRDMANKLYQLRSYRSARGQARASPARRRSS